MAQETSFDPTYIVVENEGASLKVWHQGQGPLLILVQGGGGDGQRFNASIPLLSQHYTVATYDRRGNGGSTVAEPAMLNPMQSARDIVAIIKALGETSAHLFGTSSGGLIALQVAESFPSYAKSLIVHEVPFSSILPEESMKRVDSGYAVYQTYLTQGAEAALSQFQATVSGNPPKPVPANTGARQGSHRLDYFFRYEFLVFHIYTPNLARIGKSGVPIATVEGAVHNGEFHVESARVQSKLLGCRHVVWTGGHAPFVTHPVAFAEDLHKTVQILMAELEGRKE